ncbi:RNA-directed DNA polymerase (Reverse transcriptase), partial [Trifolium medium]|nr:RNA-directed DNA polymerase (Reverse transcriptase) [Trifolium medium]
MQDKRPIAYFSKALGVRNLAKSTYEKELMAVVLAIQHWRSYLLGRKFVVSTDQKSLKQLLQQRIVTADQQNWAAKLLGYDFEIVYKQGKLNKGADALSRMHEGAEIRAMSSYVTWIQEGQIQMENQQDEKLKKIVEEVQTDSTLWPGFEYKQGVLLYEGRRVAANVYWIGMKSTIQEFVRSCDTCQRQKYMAPSPGGLLQPLPIPEQ